MKEDEPYISLHLHPNKPILFLGTSRGCIDMWDIENNKLIAELRYLQVDDFGDQIPVDDPVVSISSNEDCSLVYGFMGNAAYCIDVELKVIIQQIPISENVIHGCVSPFTGEVGVVTDVGYISEWSPRFYERVYSYELLHSLTESYVCYGSDTNFIMVLSDKIIVFGIEDEKRFYAEVSWVELDINLQAYLDKITHDMNNTHRVYISDTVIVDHRSSPNPLDTNNPFIFGKRQADILLSENISQIKYHKEFIEDFRLQRIGKDRYIAEIDAMKSKKPIIHEKSRISVEEDVKTLSYAFDDLKSDDLRKKTTARDVIRQICRRNQIKYKYLTFAWLTLGTGVNLIDYARLYEFQAYRRKKQISRFLITNIMIIISLLILNHIFYSDISFYSQAIVLLYFYLSSYKWSKVNTNPRIIGIEELKLFRILMLIVSVYIFVRLIMIFIMIYTF